MPSNPSAAAPAPLRLGVPADEALSDFLSWVSSRGLSLYSHQEAAVLELFSGNHVVLDAPTGSGKSLVAQALHWRTFVEGGRSWYTAPVKALVSEKFFDLCRIFGAENVGMLTGDAAVNRAAPIVCCTAEILANLAMREGPESPVQSAVLDEFHYYADRDRGTAWQIPLLRLPRTQFLLMSATLGDTSAIAEDLQRRSGRPVSEVRGVERPVPLQFEYSLSPIHEAIADLIRRDRAPVYVVHFTQNDAADQAQALMSVDFCSKEEKRALAEALRGFRFASPFGATLRRTVLHGVGLHHAGLLPRYRRLVERLAQQGLLKVVCGTDTLGVGINVPIRTVLFTKLCKFDGEKTEILKVRDFKQISGRAGRAGFDTLGTVVVQAPEHVIENRRLEAKAGKDPARRKRIVKAQPPQHGYKHWDETIFRQLVERPPEKLESRFSVDHGRLLMLMQHAQDRGKDARAGYEALKGLVESCHESPGQREKLKWKAAELLESLGRAGVVENEPDGRLVLAAGLQRDFSLHHSLSLLLLDALATLDPLAEEHPQRVLAWVEAILEQPRPILFKQQDRERLSRLMELKAQGVPYEERQEILDEISWPKPFAESIYSFFNEYLAQHPWIDGEAIRPKGVVAAMLESWASFNDFVKDLGVERAEGVLLRYVSEVWKALVQNVPQAQHSERLLDVAAWLRAMLAQVDSSLVTEWEAMRAGTDGAAGPVEGGAADAPPRPLDISADPRRFAARVRAELHALVRALSRRDWEEAARCVRRQDDGPWGAEEIERALAPFLAEFGDVAFDHRARLPARTVMREIGPKQWDLRQVLVPRGGAELSETEKHGFEDADREGGEDLSWAIQGRIDLSEDSNPDGPLVEVLGVGG